MRSALLAALLSTSTAFAAAVEVKVAPAFALAERAAAGPAAPLILPPSVVPVQAPQAGAETPKALLPRIEKALEASGPQASPAERVGGMWTQALQENAPAGGTPVDDARWTAALESARQTTGPAVEKALKARAKGTSVRAVLAAKDTKTITEYNGVPSRTAELGAKGVVFRHWVVNEKDLAPILAARMIKAGPTSYVEFTGSSRAYIKDIYPDLRGVFFTAPRHEAKEPRVLNQDTPHYVDFRLPEGVRALSLDGDVVMMIPAEPGAEIPIEIVGSSAK